MSLLWSVPLLLLAAGAAAAAPTLIVDVDFNDEVYIRPEPMTQAEVEKLVKKLGA